MLGKLRVCLIFGVVVAISALPVGLQTDHGARLGEARLLIECSEEGWSDEDSFQALMEAAQDPQLEAFYLTKRLMATMRLVRTGREGLRDRELAEKLAAKLDETGDLAFLPLATFSQSEHLRDRRGVPVLLRKFVDREDAIALLIMMLNDDDWRVRDRAAMALAISDSRKALPFLAARLLEDEEYAVRLYCAYALDAIARLGLPKDDGGSPTNETIDAAREWIAETYGVELSGDDHGE